MSAFIARRLLGAIPLLLLVSLISYALMGLAPGGPAAIIGQQAHGMTPAARAHFIALLGLNRPWYVQYFYWLGALVLHGSLGNSYVDGRPVIEKILEKLPITLELVGSALVVTLAIAIPLGVAAATWRGSWFDSLLNVVAFVAYGIPVFWLGIVLIDLFAMHLRWFPIAGANSFGGGGGFSDRADHLVLPVASLVIVSFASWMRYQRAAMIETLGQPYVRTARAKGLSERLVLFRHALRNALIPILTLVGLSLPSLVGGAYFVEYVFSLPGMGYLGLNSVFSRDYPTVMAITLFSAVLVIVGNLLADVAYALADPRIRYD
ncbi:MAG: ABC transporter permease [Vulcanimicrobiaceae bacterium]